MDVPSETKREIGVSAILAVSRLRNEVELHTASTGHVKCVIVPDRTILSCGLYLYFVEVVCIELRLIVGIYGLAITSKTEACDVPTPAVLDTVAVTCSWAPIGKLSKSEMFSREELVAAAVATVVNPGHEMP